MKTFYPNRACTIGFACVIKPGLGETAARVPRSHYTNEFRMGFTNIDLNEVPFYSGGKLNCTRALQPQHSFRLMFK